MRSKSGSVRASLKPIEQGVKQAMEAAFGWL